MKANGPMFCVEVLRLAAHRRLPLSASAGKNKNKNGGKAEATMEGKRSERVREGTGGRGGRAGRAEGRSLGGGEISPGELGAY